MVPIRAKLQDDAVTFGTWLTLGSPLACESICKVGFDWVIVDNQHGSTSEAQLLSLLYAIEVTGTPAIVRVPWLDPSMIMRAGDLGASGIIVPMVSTPEDARKVVEAFRYPPLGMRSFGPVRELYTPPASPREDPLCLLLIETVEGVENAEAIAATEGIDGMLVGPGDLALSMGQELRAGMSPEVLDAVSHVASVCRKHDLIPASVVAGGLDNAREQIKRGMRFLASGADTMFMVMGAAQNLQGLRGCVEG